MANWSNYSTNENGICISALLNINNWSAFATPINNNIMGYVEAAIGSPTAEMFAASWTESGEISLSMTDTKDGIASTNGYYYNYNGIVNLYQNNLIHMKKNLYFPKYEAYNDGIYRYYWLSSPTAYATARTCCVKISSGINVTYNKHTISNTGIRPVVCLKASIPASISYKGIITLVP